MSESARLHLVNDDAASFPQPVWAVGHEVQFYEAEEFLYDTVGEFLRDGVKAAQPIVVIASAVHRGALTEKLRSLHVDAQELVDGRDAVWLDARDTLAAFMEGGMPNAELFRTTVGGVFDALLENRRYLVVRAYGEMVDLLWKDGNIDGAIALEDLWNELAAKYSFSLLCAYSMANFHKEAHTDRFQDICARHGRILPAESYRQGSEQKLRDFLDRAPEGIHWVAPDGIIIWANRHELETLGYDREEYVGQHIMKFHADRAAVDDMLERLARGEPLRDFAATMLARDGRRIRVLVNSNVVWEGDRFVHTRCFTRVLPGDIS
jgi:PAS domain S-box-containing protein